jgi:hypothetical protein
MLGQQLGIEAVVHLWGSPRLGGDNRKYSRQKEKRNKKAHRV